MSWQTAEPLNQNCPECRRRFKTHNATQVTCSRACARARKTRKQRERRYELNAALEEISDQRYLDRMEDLRAIARSVRNNDMSTLGDLLHDFKGTQALRANSSRRS